MALKYNGLSSDVQKRIIEDKNNNWKNPYSFCDEDAIRRDMSRDKPNLWRPTFIRDIEKILHLPAYNRYADKTQVFSLYSNDDISRRALHVQLVSRIARNIGSLLGLNINLIEAIALGHDLGHTPFGHAGERYLNDILYNETGRHFNHNVQSVRVLDILYRRNLTLQALDGILCHDGENECKIYIPETDITFDKLDCVMNESYYHGIKGGIIPNPSTLEGCVVRVSDMIAYLGKDRQDAVKAEIIESNNVFSANSLGNDNAEIINNLMVDVVENSYRHNYISFGDECFEALKTVKKENYSLIYKNDRVRDLLDNDIKQMFSDIYYRLLFDLKNNNTESVIFKHHIDFITENCKYYNTFDYMKEDADIIVTDYISSMTDDYFIKLYEFLFPDKHLDLKYKSYFDNI